MVAALFERIIVWLVSSGFQRDVAVNITTDVLVSIILVGAITASYRALRNALPTIYERIIARMRGPRKSVIMRKVNDTAARIYDLVDLGTAAGLGRPSQIGQSTFAASRGTSSEPTLTFAFLERASRHSRAHAAAYQLVDISSNLLEADDVEAVVSFLSVSSEIRTIAEETRSRLVQLAVGAEEYVVIALSRVIETCDDAGLPRGFEDFDSLQRWHDRYQSADHRALPATR